MKPLIIGQAPGPNTDPDVPLSGRSGRRLADLCGLSLEDFLARFRRVNLIDKYPGKADGKGDAFPLERARRGAIELLMTGAFAASPVVLLGDNVARAFNFKPRSYPLVQLLPCGVSRHGIAFCPHPSGTCHWWNDPENVKRARAFWAMLATKR